MDQPDIGFFVIRLVKGGPWMPARILHDFGHWWAEIDGKETGTRNEAPLAPNHPVLRIWHYGREITREDYHRRLSQPDRPDPTKPVDLRSTRSLF